MNDPVTPLVDLFERFSQRDVEVLGTWYREDASFKDPFNDVRGIDAIRRVYDHMFETLEQPRFKVTQTTAQGSHCWLTWEFRFGAASQPRLVHGATHITFAGDGRIQAHRDYWDPAEELYEKLPVLGTLMRLIKRRLAAPA
jgi:steroid delta-isomerase